MVKPTRAKPADGGSSEQAKLKAAKRSPLPLCSDHTPAFVKAWTRYEKAGRVRLTDVKVVMALIIDNSGPLPARYKDHALAGDYAGFRECHVHGDLLLVYRIATDGRTVVFTDMGTHAELFE